MSEKLPYLIYIPDWAWNSGGVRSCHYLAHLLNEYGYETALIGHKTNPAWSTLCLQENQEEIDRWHDRGAIFVIPDMYEGHPFGARHRVLRYVCNRPGFFTGTKHVEYLPHELQIPFTRLLNTMGAADEDILFLPYIETELFRPEARPRDSGLFWVGKRKEIRINDGYGRQSPGKLRAITYKWPKHRRELAHALKHSRVLYSFDDLTALVTEAGLCGCPAVIVPTRDYSKANYAASELGLDGIAWGTDELEHAICTVYRCYDNYLRVTAQTEARVLRFIERTQQHYAQLPTDPLPVSLLPPPPAPLLPPRKREGNPSRKVLVRKYRRV